MYPENYDLEIAIEETKHFFDNQLTSTEEMKNRIGKVLNSATVVISLAGALQFVHGGFDMSAIGIREYVLIIAVILYIVIIILNASTTIPTTLTSPIKIEWESFEELYFNKPPKQLLENRLENYLDAVDLNRDVLRSLARQARCAAWVFVLIAAALLALILIP